MRNNSLSAALILSTALAVSSAEARPGSKNGAPGQDCSAEITKNRDLALHITNLEKDKTAINQKLQACSTRLNDTLENPDNSIRNLSLVINVVLLSILAGGAMLLRKKDRQKTGPRYNLNGIRVEKISRPAERPASPTLIEEPIIESVPEAEKGEIFVERTPIGGEAVNFSEQQIAEISQSATEALTSPDLTPEQVFEKVFSCYRNSDLTPDQFPIDKLISQDRLEIIDLLRLVMSDPELKAGFATISSRLRSCGFHPEIIIWRNTPVISEQTLSLDKVTDVSGLSRERYGNKVLIANNKSHYLGIDGSDTARQMIIINFALHDEICRRALGQFVMTLDPDKMARVKDIIEKSPEYATFLVRGLCTCAGKIKLGLEDIEFRPEKSRLPKT